MHVILDHVLYMSHNISICKPTIVPGVKTCTNFGSEGVSTSINASLGPFNYKYSGDTHQIGLCTAMPYVPFGTICGGIKYDSNNINSFMSLGAKIGNTGYQYKPDFNAIYNHIMGNADGRTEIIGTGFVTSGPAVERCETNARSGGIPKGPSSVPEPDIPRIDINNIADILQKCDSTISNLQNKIDKIMEKNNITAQDIGFTIDRTPLGTTSTTPLVTPEQIATHQIILSVNNIISDVKTNIPNYTIFDVLNGINQNAIDKTKLLEVINSANKGSQNLIWRVNKNEGTMGSFYPDCCEPANQCGWQIDYHIVHKIDYCRICLTPFRMEYFL